ncbi:MAG TPA: DUF4190 domain-containing protein [Thermoanaerobaculia bacterium]|nr:DUF4190 domain-containing protein [Thermoanaerobaculia bacterium]
MATTAAPDKPSSQAVTALVLGILSFVCCQILGPVAWYLGNQEQRSIREGRSPAAGQGFATAGVILGIIGTVLLVFTLFWIFAMGGMAIVGGILEGMN